MGKKKLGRSAAQSKARSTTKTTKAKAKPAKASAKRSPQAKTKASSPARAPQKKPAKRAAPKRSASAPKKASPRTTAASTTPRATGSTSERALGELSARWPIVSDAERDAFASLITDTQADELGRRTKAVDVRDEAARWAVVIDGALRMYPGALEGYAPRRFAYLLSVARELSTTIASEESKRGHLGDVRGSAQHARDTAIEARAFTIDRLTTFAGNRGPERATLAQAIGNSDPVELLIRSLRALAHLEIDWVERNDPASQVLAESAGLSTKDAAGLRACAEALSAKRVAASLEGRSVVKDTPSMNRVEGRLLFEMREAKRIFGAAHDKNAVIPNLIPGAGVRAVIGGKRSVASPTPPPPAPSSPGDAMPTTSKTDGVSAHAPN